MDNEKTQKLYKTGAMASAWTILVVTVLFMLKLFKTQPIYDMVAIISTFVGVMNIYDYKEADEPKKSKLVLGIILLLLAIWNIVSYIMEI